MNEINKNKQLIDVQITQTNNKQSILINILINTPLEMLKSFTNMFKKLFACFTNNTETGNDIIAKSLA